MGKRNAKAELETAAEDEEMMPLSEESLIRLEEDGIVKIELKAEGEEPVKTDVEARKEEFWILAGFAISFGMTLPVVIVSACFDQNILEKSCLQGFFPL